MFPLLQQSVYIVCRCCLSEQPRISHIISHNPSIHNELRQFVPKLQILPNDVICDLCLQRLHNALDFRKRCEDSENILRARHEQALDDAVECLEREVGTLDVKEIVPKITPVDFDTLDLSESYGGSSYASSQLSSSGFLDTGTLNTPLHLPATLESIEEQLRKTHQLFTAHSEKPTRGRVPLRCPPRPRTPKSLCQCTECEKKFTRNFQLKLHMNSVHGLGEGPQYVCELCSKSFASRHSLRYHETSQHSTERPYACDQCERRFVLRTQLISHNRVHTGKTKPRIYNCSVCQKTWLTQSDLRTHMRTHNPEMVERPHKCHICYKAFFTRGHLRAHHLVHTGEKPYGCNYCDRVYQSVSNLNTHMARQHANILEEQLEL